MIVILFIPLRFSKRIMKIFLSVTLIFLLSAIHAQNSDKHTLSGYITDSKSGEALIGVKVFIPEINKGAITNTYGFYSLTVSSGVYTVEFRSAIHLQNFFHQAKKPSKNDIKR